MTVLAALYIVGVYTIPALKSLSTDFLAWMIFGVYILVLLFVWSLSFGHRYEKISEEKNSQLNDTKDVLKEKSKWHL